MILDDCVDFEENSKVMDFTYSYKNIHIWPYLRDIVLFKVLQKELGVVASNSSMLWKKNLCRDYIKYNTFNLPQSDILFISSSVLYVLSSNGKMYDRLFNDFMSLYKGKATTLIQCSANIDLCNLENNGIPFSIDMFISDLIRIEGEYNDSFDRELKNINELIKYLKKEFPYKIEEGVYRLFIEMALKTIKEFPFYYKYYKRLADIVSPKIILCIGGMYVKPFIKVFNDYGIITAEFQHGMINKHHRAYFHSKKNSKSDIYRQYMPKYFLSWGSFWEKDINIPSKIYTVGNPTVANKKVQYKRKNIKEIKNSILIVLGREADIYVKFVKDLLESRLSKFKIFIKPHPTYLSEGDYFHDFEKNSDVKVVTGGDIYEYIFKSEYIIGDGSTALFEAAALNKQVFILNSKNAEMIIGKNFGVWINDANDFVKYISEKYDVDISGDAYFKEDWDVSFSKFIKEVANVNRL